MNNDERLSDIERRILVLEMFVENQLCEIDEATRGCGKQNDETYDENSLVHNEFQRIWDGDG